MATLASATFREPALNSQFQIHRSQSAYEESEEENTNDEENVNDGSTAGTESNANSGERDGIEVVDLDEDGDSYRESFNEQEQ